MVRCFVGVFLEDDAKTYILSLQNQLENLNLDCKFVEEQNIHVSLSFIGDVDGQKLDEISTSLKLLGNFKKFSVKTSKIKLIPNENFVRVIALDVVGSGLNELQDSVVKLVGGDIKPPHITLCRVRSRLSQQQIEMIKSVSVKEIESLVNSVDLVQSTITRRGPVYESLSKYKLV